MRGLKARLVRLAFPLYRSERSNHLYTQHQHLVLLVLRQWMGKSYREFCEWMGVCTSVLKVLGLSAMPHFTTLHKFSGRLDEELLDRLLGSYAEQLDDVQLAVDSTGFSCTSASHYFVEVLKRSKEKGGGDQDEGDPTASEADDRRGRGYAIDPGDARSHRPDQRLPGHDPVAAEGVRHRPGAGGAGRQGLRFGGDPPVHLVHHARGVAYTAQAVQERPGESYPTSKAGGGVR